MSLLSRLLGGSKGAAGPNQPVSLVLLLRTPIRLSAGQLRERLAALYPGHFLAHAGGANDSFVIDTERPEIHMIKSLVPGASGMFFYHAVEKPYTGFSRFLRKIEDSSLRRAAASATSWASIDLIGPVTTRADAYRLIGQALADIAPLDTVAIVHPHTEITRPFSEEARAALRDPAVPASLGFPPAVEDV